MGKRKVCLYLIEEGKGDEVFHNLRKRYEIIKCGDLEENPALLKSQVAALLVYIPIFNAKDFHLITKLKCLYGNLPFLVCSEEIDTSRIFQLGKLGVDNFVHFQKGSNYLINTIDKAIQSGGLARLLVEMGIDITFLPPRMRKAYQLIIENFPVKIKAEEIARTLGIGRCYFEVRFKKYFGIPYCKFIRLIKIYEMINLIQYTSHDNESIALILNYSSETSMARDFRKTLDMNPTEVRNGVGQIDFIKKLKIFYGNAEVLNIW